MKDEKNKKKRIYFVVVLVVLCFLYLGARATYTSYESRIGGDVETTIAGINLKINGINVMTGTNALNNNILLDNITWTSTHTRTGKIAPGSHGTIELELDPSGSDVAIMYDFRYIDKTMDDSKYIVFTNISADDNGIIRTDIDTYTGVITVDDLEDGKTVTVTIDFEFDNSVDIEGFEEDLQNYDDLFDIYFHAIQYTGETIEEYVEPEPEPEPEPDAGD